MYDIGPYTLGEHKVIWRRMDRAISAAVVKKVHDKFLGPRVCVPQETCVFINCGSQEEAHYLCALLNSVPVDFIAQSYNVRGGKSFGSPNLMQFARIPAFVLGNSVHGQLSSLSRNCHNFAREGRLDKLRDAEKAIHRSAAKLWGITREQLKAIQEALGDISMPRRERNEEDDD